MFFLAALFSFLVAVNGQECDTKPQVRNFTLADNDTRIFFYGTFSGEVVKCLWYVNDASNDTTSGAINGSEISCPLPLFIVNRLSNNEDMTGSPLQGTQNQASIGGGIGFKIDIQLNVYYTSTVNQMASDCVGDKISVAGGTGPISTLPPETNPALPACCVSATDSTCRSDCQASPNFAALSRCALQDINRIVNCTADSCGFDICEQQYMQDKRGGLTDMCSILSNYETCLNGIRSDCVGYVSRIQQAKMDVAGNLSSMCSTTAPPTLAPTTQVLTTKPTTPTPIIGNPKERDVAHCCQAQSAIAGECLHMCAVSYPRGFESTPSPENYTELELVCIPDIGFQRCLRERAAPSTVHPFTAIPTSLPVINQLYEQLKECADEYGGGVDCVNSLKFPVTNPQTTIDNCITNKPGVERCFHDTSSLYFHSDFPHSSCCEQGMGGACQGACRRGITAVWTALFGITDIDDDSSLYTAEEALLSSIQSTCPNLKDIEKCADDTPNYDGPSIETIETAMNVCCTSSPPKGLGCRSVCEVLRQRDVGRPNFEFCFTEQETDFLRCAIVGSQTNAMTLRNLLRSQFYDQYKYKNVSSCCIDAQSTQCTTACPTALQGMGSAAWYSNCRSNTAESALLTCVSNVQYGPCDGSGCRDDMQFCNGFNNRQEQFRLCGTLLDGLAAATYTEWVTDRMMTIGGTQVALKDVASCDMTQFKTLACFRMAQPCHRDNDLAFICRDDCVDLFTKCKSVNESLSAEDICRRLGSSQTECFELSSFTSSTQLIVRSATVQLELPTKIYTIALQDPGSQTYQMLSSEVKSSFESLFVSAPGVQSIDVVGFSGVVGGLVVVNFTLTSRSYSNEPSIESLLLTLQASVDRGEVGTLDVATGSLQYQIREGAGSTPSGFAVVMASYELLLTGVLLCLTFMFNK
ncbi:uncharacterized protein LOC134187157 [Corticium candelabrum]|uniref:uncharacterized protein LOC134187157 n=1 Tax=Corticium candelabrum TaxID=121492 RepID=UPI002E26AC34|nr:uncharacterized protein LOC134187157 [Corticium candelabrum]